MTYSANGPLQESDIRPSFRVLVPTRPCVTRYRRATSPGGSMLVSGPASAGMVSQAASSSAWCSCFPVQVLSKPRRPREPPAVHEIVAPAMCHSCPKAGEPLCSGVVEWRRRADSNRRIGVLQTPALDHLATSPRGVRAALCRDLPCTQGVNIPNRAHPCQPGAETPFGNAAHPPTTGAHLEWGFPQVILRGMALKSKVPLT